MTRTLDGGSSEQGTCTCEQAHSSSAVSIRIPVAGIYVAGSDRPDRFASAVCAICLNEYKVGSEIVWSSNMDCEHVFHVGCAEEWLFKGRENYSCPCCRRDYIVDVYDPSTALGNHAAIKGPEVVRSCASGLDADDC